MAFDKDDKTEILQGIQLLNQKLDKVLELEGRIKILEQEMIERKMWESNIDGRILVTTRLLVLFWGIVILIVSYVINKIFN